MDREMLKISPVGQVEGPSFLHACRETLGKNRVRWAKIGQDTGALPRSVSGIVEAGSINEVQSIIRLANQHGIHLSPVSTGKNRGFGSALPVKSGACLLDLHRMNKIREINITFGFAVVEPGVTQGDLAEALRAQNAPWMLDVTGAGPDTSLVGNALERGIAYHSQRTTTTRALEVVLGDGSLLTTGFQDPRVGLLNNLYAHGVGPDPVGLFYQSRFGVVTAMTIDLMPVAATHASVGLNLKTDRIPQLIESLGSLRRQGALEGVPHIANRARFFSTMVPLMVRRSKKPISRAQAEKMLLQVFPEEWTLLASVRGPTPLANAKASLIKRALKPLGRVLVLTPFMRFLQRLAGWLVPSIRAVMEATASVQELPLGVPSGDPLHFLDFDVPEAKTTSDLDGHRRGFIYLVPLMPSDDQTVRQFLKTLPALGAATGQEPAVTLNALDARVLEAVVSLTFDKSNEEEVQRVVTAGEKWLDQLKNIGAHPYRLHIDHMGLTGPAEGAWVELQKKLSMVFDPNETLSRGRYDPEEASKKEH